MFKLYDLASVRNRKNNTHCWIAVIFLSISLLEVVISFQLMINWSYFCCRTMLPTCCIQGCHFSDSRQISAYLHLLWAADCFISLFLNEIMCTFLSDTDQVSNAVSKYNNIQSFSIHYINISIHLNLILIYATIYKELKIIFIFDKCVHKFTY